MSRTSLKLLALAATVVALGAAASVAQAGGPVAGTGDQIVYSPFCNAVTPQASISASGPVTSASSNGNAYFYSPQGQCYRYVVAVTAPLSGQFTITVAPSVAPASKSLCSELSGDAAIYTKPFLATSFSLAHYAHLHGQWVDGGLIAPHCSLVEDTTPAAFTSDPWASTTSATYLTNVGFFTSFRVAVGMKLGDWESVTVTAAPYTPPSDPH
jgi:hypothetical protein